jgi:RNA polymerase primary sigma factor
MPATLTHSTENQAFDRGFAWPRRSEPTPTTPTALRRSSVSVSFRTERPVPPAAAKASSPQSGQTGVRAEISLTGYKDLLSAPQEQDLVRRMAHPRSRAEYEAARQALITANMRLVAFVARRYQRGTLLLEDLVQEGAIGLIQAIDRFDYRQGVRLSTYALWWIRQAILRALSEQGDLIRLPVHVQTSLRRLQQAQQRLSLRLERSPSEEELAQAAGLTEEQVNQLFARSLSVISLETPAGPTQETALGDLIPAPEESDPALQVARNDRGDLLRQALDALSPKEQEIVTWRFGLEGEEPKSLEEVSRACGVSRERVRQMEVRALQKLRRQAMRSALA